MKLKTTLLLVGACTGLMAANASAQALVAVEPDHCVELMDPLPPSNPLPPDDSGATGDDVVTEEIVDPDVTEPDPGTEIKDDGVVIEDPVCHEGVPIDWIRRNDGGELENPDVIFYTLGAGGPLQGAGAAEVSGDAGKDEALPFPKVKIAPVKALARNSSKTKAVVKSGRVFLRR